MLPLVRAICRRYLNQQNVLKRIPEDIAWIFDIPGETEGVEAPITGMLWDEENGQISGGINHAGRK